MNHRLFVGTISADLDSGSNQLKLKNNDSLPKELIKMTFDEIEELVDYHKKLALEYASAINI